jgi:hypothetical protein
MRLAAAAKHLANFDDILIRQLVDRQQFDDHRTVIWRHTPGAGHSTAYRGLTRMSLHAIVGWLLCLG